MSILIVNGIEIKLTHTNEFRVTPQLSKDGADVISTKYHLDFTGVFNPQATSWVRTGNGPVQFDGMSPIETYNAIHRQLTTNRSVVELWYGDEIVLHSPPLNSAYDTSGGPTVIGLNLVPMGETKTWIVRIIIETELDDCTGYAPIANDNALSSNRWESTHSIDELNYTTIETRGIAIFRLDSLFAQDINPDHFRDLVLPAIPAGFMRRHVNISLDSKGRFLIYHVMDRQMPYSLGSKNGPNSAGTPAMSGVRDYRASIFTSAPPIQKGSNQFGLAIAGPMTVIGITIDAIGDATASRYNLLQFCCRLAVERLELNPAIKARDGGTIVRYVEVTESVERQMISLKVEAYRPAGNGKDKNTFLGAGRIWTKMLGIDSLPETFPGDANQGAPGGLLPQLANDGNTRGTFNGEMFAQALQLACDAKYKNNFCKPNDGFPGDNLQDCFEVINTDDPIQLVPPYITRDKPRPGLTTYIDINIIYETPRSIYGAPTANRKAPEPESPGGSGGTGGEPTPSCPEGFIYDTECKQCCPDNGQPHTCIGCIAPPAKIDPGGGTGGTTSPGETPGGFEIMTLASPFTLVAVEWTAECIGAMPTLPAPSDPSKKLVLTNSKVQPMSVQSVDGDNLVYSVTGRYDYLAKDYIDPEKKSMFMGTVPFESIDTSEATIDPGHFEGGIIFPA